MAPKRTIYFRADGNGEIGYGHVIRSLALADMLVNDFSVVFISKESSKLLQQEIEKVCSEIIWIPEDLNLYGECEYLKLLVNSNSIFVTDGYYFDTLYQRKIKVLCSKLVCIDDLHAFPYEADAVINQSGSVRRSDYQFSESCKLYSGLNYLLLRKPFLKVSRIERVLKSLSSVFICFGGAGDHLAVKAVEAAKQVDFIEEIHVVLSKSFNRQKYIEQLESEKNKKVIVYSQLSAEEMCDLMTKCDLAVCPSSSISLELCSVGIALISGFYVDNQKDIYEYGKANGFFVSAGDFNRISPAELAALFPTLEQAQQMVKRQKARFRGESSNYILSLFRSL